VCWWGCVGCVGFVVGQTCFGWRVFCLCVTWWILQARIRLRYISGLSLSALGGVRRRVVRVGGARYGKSPGQLGNHRPDPRPCRKAIATDRHAQIGQGNGIGTYLKGRRSSTVVLNGAPRPWRKKARTQKEKSETSTGWLKERFSMGPPSPQAITLQHP